jgi:hypothetical protein
MEIPEIKGEQQMTTTNFYNHCFCDLSKIKIQKQKGESKASKDEKK